MKKIKLGAKLVALILGIFALTMATPTNRAFTSPTPTDPSLKTRYYRPDLGQVSMEAAQVLVSLKTYGRAWRLVTRGTTLEDGAMILKAEVPVIVFTDDLMVTMAREGTLTKVDVTSASRIGKGDFGENRRHILQFLHALDQKLAPQEKSF